MFYKSDNPNLTRVIVFQLFGGQDEKWVLLFLRFWQVIAAKELSTSTWFIALTGFENRIFEHSSKIQPCISSNNTLLARRAFAFSLVMNDWEEEQGKGRDDLYRKCQPLVDQALCISTFSPSVLSFRHKQECSCETAMVPGSFPCLRDSAPNRGPQLISCEPKWDLSAIQTTHWDFSCPLLLGDSGGKSVSHAPRTNPLPMCETTGWSFLLKGFIPGPPLLSVGQEMWPQVNERNPSLLGMVIQPFQVIA